MSLSLAEALANALIGLAVSWAVTFWLLPLWGLQPGPVEAAQITALYFVVSTLRGFAVREAFRRLTRRVASHHP